VSRVDLAMIDGVSPRHISPNNMQPTRLTPQEYPTLIRELHKQPEFLDIVGTLPDDGYKFLCVIGARRYSSYGKEVCSKLISGLKNYPIVIVSGLAIGIDSLAHRCALDSGLTTIAWPGSGLSDSVLYPSMHLELAKEIVNSGGAILSPFERDQHGTKWTFPVRNELMAAMSHATLIIEAREGSGTMLTANAAVEMGRDVLIVPGSIFSDLSHGPHTLWNDGATPVTSSGDILRALGFVNHTEDDRKKLDSLNLFSLSTQEKILTDHLRSGPLGSAILMEKMGIPISEFNILISKSELKDLIHEQGGKYHLGK
jgi:DNA processing protein